MKKRFEEIYSKKYHFSLKNSPPQYISIFGGIFFFFSKKNAQPLFSDWAKKLNTTFSSLEILKNPNLLPFKIFNCL
jgi:hypothetical protein